MNTAQSRYPRGFLLALRTQPIRMHIVDRLIFDVQEYADPDPPAGPEGCHKPRTLREFQMSKACRFLPIIF